MGVLVKYEKIESIEDGVVYSKNQVLIKTTKEQSEELKKALKTIQEYEKLALEAYKKEYKHDARRDSDWCEVGYSVKNDCVFVTIRNGMAG
jgi:hypothetical protein